LFTNPDSNYIASGLLWNSGHNDGESFRLLERTMATRANV
jgi:hypothetical protein